MGAHYTYRRRVDADPAGIVPRRSMAARRPRPGRDDAVRRERPDVAVLPAVYQGLRLPLCDTGVRTPARGGCARGMGAGGQDQDEPPCGARDRPCSGAAAAGYADATESMSNPADGVPVNGAAEDVLTSPEAGGRVIRGSAWRLGGSAAGMLAGIATAALLLRHLGVADSGRYVTVISLVAIAGTIADGGLNITGSRELALREPEGRTALMANFLGLRLAITPVALLAIVAFAALAGYPTRMV